MYKLNPSEITWNKKKETEHFNVHISSNNDWVFVDGGLKNGVAIKCNGTMWIWGDNQYGQIGNNSLNNSLIPVQEKTKTNWTYANISKEGTVALNSLDELYLAGNDSNVKNIMMNQNVMLLFTKYNTLNIKFKFFSINNSSHMIALDNNGYLYSAGGNQFGECLNLNLNAQRLLSREYTNSIWKSASIGVFSTHCIREDGALFSAGRNENGVFGDGTTNNSIFLVQEITKATDWKQVDACKYQSTCFAIKNNGTLWAWGNNKNGLLGIKNTSPTFSTTPVQEATNSTNWSYVSAGDSHVLALKSDGSLFSWGFNMFGQLGKGNTLNSLQPTQILVGTTWKFIAARGNSSYGIKTDGTLWTWGDNTNGQLGLNDTNNRLLPMQILLPDFWPQQQLY
jgi:alpha-tubulin suppressor-like RCC1 family protein